MDYITVALPKGKLFQRSVELLAKVGYSADNVTEIRANLLSVTRIARCAL